MNISILLPDLRGGGAERVMLDLGVEFARRGHCVEYVVMQAVGEFLTETERNFSVVELGARRARHLPGLLSGYLRRKQPDALLVAMWPLTAIASIAGRAVGFRGKTVLTEHAILSRQYAGRGPLHRACLHASAFLGYRMATACVGVSNGTAADMAALSHMSRKNFVTIHNPVRKAGAVADDGIAAANALWGTCGQRILTVGNLKAVKNHSLLLRAFARLCRPDARLMLVGQGQEEASLRSLADRLGVADRVIFAGFQRDPSPFYATADVFVLSSDHEGFGNVIVEALSHGLPVVATDCPSGPAEILENGRFGRLVPVGDEFALATALNEALAGESDPVVQANRADDFAPEIAAGKYLELLGLQ